MTATPDNAEAQEPGSTENSNAIALGLIGDEWNLTIIRLAIMSDVRRYKDFRDRLGIANSVLTVRLRRLDRGRRVHHVPVLRRAAPVRVRPHRTAAATCGRCC